MSMLRLAVALASLIGMSLAFAPAFAAEPAPPPKAPAEPAVAADVAAVLDKMDAVGKDLKTVTAKFDYELNQTAYDDKQKRKGELQYQAPNLLRFAFTDTPPEILHLRRPQPLPEEGWHQAIDHLADPAGRRSRAGAVAGTWEDAVPPALRPAQGGGAEAVHRHARRRRGEEADKDGRTVLTLVPKADTPLARDYAKIMLWIDPKTSPARRGCNSSTRRRTARRSISPTSRSTRNSTPRRSPAPRCRRTGRSSTTRRRSSDKTQSHLIRRLRRFRRFSLWFTTAV